MASIFKDRIRDCEVSCTYNAPRQADGNRVAYYELHIATDDDFMSFRFRTPPDLWLTTVTTDRRGNPLLTVALNGSSATIDAPDNPIAVADAVDKAMDAAAAHHLDALVKRKVDETRVKAQGWKFGDSAVT